MEQEEQKTNNEQAEQEVHKPEKKWTDAFKSKNTESKIDEIKAKLNPENNIVEKLTTENAQLKDKFIRTVAELENTRRIAGEEKEKALKFAISKFANDLIPVMENFFLAFKHINNVENVDKTFYECIQLTFNELKKAFERNGIKRLFPLKEKFDPNLHQAISYLENEEEEGTIIDVLQAGYIINDRVLRPAMVAVSKGKEEKKEE